MRKNINLLLSFMLLTLIIACNNNKDKETAMSAGTLSNVKIVNELDPVCKMSTAEHLKDTLSYDGKLYGFCNTNCKEEFKKDPKKYLEK